MNKLTVAMNGLMPSLQSLVEEWQPGKLQKELAYRDSLMNFIKQKAPDAHVEREYRYEGTTLDLAVMWEGLVSNGRVFIELKLNLKQKSQLDRLVGQIELIDVGSNFLILVLCGETNSALYDRLRKKYRKYLNDSMLGEGNSLVIIQKQIGRAAKA